MSELYEGRRIDFADRFIRKGQKKATRMLIEIKGEDKRFKRTCIRVPKGYFSERPQQIFHVSIVAKNHLPYRYRVMMGPSYRADLWALLDSDPNISAYALGKKAHCSYRAAYMAKKDYKLLQENFCKRNSGGDANLAIGPMLTFQLIFNRFFLKKIFISYAVFTDISRRRNL